MLQTSKSHIRLHILRLEPPALMLLSLLFQIFFALGVPVDRFLPLHLFDRLLLPAQKGTHVHIVLTVRETDYVPYLLLLSYVVVRRKVLQSLVDPSRGNFPVTELEDAGKTCYLAFARRLVRHAIRYTSRTTD
jgi:hypothetical protein